MTEPWKQWEGETVNGEFQLRQYLGCSDHSAVFLTQLGGQESQNAAIKLIPAVLRNAELQLSRWKLAAELSHPYLMRIFRMGRCRLGEMELLYVVMEFAEEDLSQILPHRPLTPAETRQMLKPVLDALAYVHSKGFVHGHIKPGNIMAIADQLKVSTDGLCRIGESGGGRGKPSVYDPPETAREGMSAAGDIWSLGMTLVEALTQRLPVWERMGDGEPFLPETLPAPFLDIARHCLRRDPRHRWTVAGLMTRLEPTSNASQQQMIARPQKAFAKSRYIVPTVAVGLALAAMLAVPRLFNRHPATPQAPSVAFEQAKVQPKPGKRPVTPDTGQPAQRTLDKKQGSSGTASSPTSLQSARGANTPAGALVQGEVADQVLPDVPQKARDTIRGTVRVSVRVHVDPLGSVVGEEFDSSGPSKYFADLALQAARDWEFEPPTVDGRNVSSEWVLRFEFTRTATKVVPVQAAP